MLESLHGDAMNPMLTAIALASLSLLPFLFVIGTSFAKFSVVLSLLRSALGTQNAPSSMILNGLAAILSIAVMSPVLGAMQDEAALVYDQSTTGEQGAASQSDDDEGPDTQAVRVSDWNVDEWLHAVHAASEPWRRFLIENSGDTELLFFRRLHPMEEETDALEDTSFWKALPAFLLTELAEAFQIGFLIFLPFLLVDLLVGSVLLALGMHMLTPTTVSLPFKLLLFVLIQGWVLLSENLLLSYTFSVGG
jgi:type III secretion protein R